MVSSKVTKPSLPTLIDRERRVSVCLIFALMVACLSVYWVIYLPATHTWAASLMICTGILHQLVQIPMMPKPAASDDVGNRFAVLLVDFAIGSVGLSVLEYTRVHASIGANQWTLLGWNTVFLGCQGLFALLDEDVGRAS
jgi:hypothetical protein